MATETVQVLRVDTGEAVSSVGELKEYIKELKKELDETKVGSEEYTDTLSELTKQQQALKAAMYGSAEAFNAIEEGTEGAVKSYNSLVQEMAALKAAWRATTDEAERADLSEKITAINNQLKDLDASTGTYKRNVGDYANQMAKGFSSVGGAASSLISPLKGVQGQMQAISATPMIAILGLIVNLIMSVINTMKKSEQGMAAMSEAFAAFSVVGDLVTKVLEAIGKVLTTVVSWLGELTAAIIGNNEAMEEKLRLAKLEREMLEDERTNIIANAQAEKESAELRAKAVDKLTYSAKERIKFLEQAGELEKQIAERNMKAAEKEYEAWQLRNKPTESSTEDKKAEAEAYAKMLQAQTAYYNKTREMTSQLNEAKKQERDEAAKAAKESIAQAQAAISAEQELLKKQIELTKQGSEERLNLEKQAAEKEYELKVSKAKNTITNQEQLNKTLLLLEEKYHKDLEALDTQHEADVVAETKLSMTNRMNQMRKGSYEQMAAALEIKRYELETLKQMEDESDEQFKARQISLQAELKEAQSALVDTTINEQKTYLERNIAATEEGSLEQLQALAELALYNWQTTYQGLNESYEDYLYRKAEAEKEYRMAEEMVGDYDQYKVDMQAELETLDTNSMEYLAKEVELKKYELDTIHKMEYESESAFQKRMVQAETAYNAEKKKLSQARMNMTMAGVSAVSGLLSGLADIYESDTDASEEELQKAKNLKIAGAVMDTISGAVAAYMSCQESYPQPYGTIIGAIQAAVVTAAGMANVRQIQSTSTSAESSNTVSANAVSLPSSATITAPQVDTTIESVRTITSAKEEEALNQSQKVYLVTDELEIAQNAKKVRTAESTF